MPNMPRQRGTALVARNRPSAILGLGSISAHGETAIMASFYLAGLGAIPSEPTICACSETDITAISYMASPSAILGGRTISGP